MKYTIWYKQICQVKSGDASQAMRVGDVVVCDSYDHQNQLENVKPHDAPPNWPPQMWLIREIKHDLTTNVTHYYCDPHWSNSKRSDGFEFIVENTTGSNSAKFKWPAVPRREDIIVVDRKFTRNGKDLIARVKDIKHNINDYSPVIYIIIGAPE